MLAISNFFFKLSPGDRQTVNKNNGGITLSTILFPLKRFSSSSSSFVVDEIVEKIKRAGRRSKSFSS